MDPTDDEVTQPDWQVLDFSNMMTLNSHALNWYNSSTSYPNGYFKGKQYKDMRKQREGSLSLNLFQRFPTHIVCAAECTTSQGTVHRVPSQSGTNLVFSIDGETEIPHFCLRLRMTTEASYRDFTLVWNAWDHENFKSRRRSTIDPSESETFTFSASLTDVKFIKTTLADNAATTCKGVAGAECFRVQWKCLTSPPMISGFNIPADQLRRLFTPGQITTLKEFRAMSGQGTSIDVMTRIRRQEVEQNWRGMTSMPNPTMAPYPFYACSYDERSRSFEEMMTIPPLSTHTIKVHHLRRKFGWPSMSEYRYADPHEILNHTANPFTVFLNEREYEAIRMIGLLREAEAQKETYIAHFNRFYEFTLLRTSDVLKFFPNKELDEYFYGVLDANLRVRDVGDADQMWLEQNMPLPEPGTPVTISPFRPKGSTCGIERNRIWQGHVVSSQGIPECHMSLNAICVRLKRPVNWESAGMPFRLAGTAQFGTPNPTIAQGRWAIRSAMWGNDRYDIAKDNKMKRLLLAHNNSTLEFYRDDDDVDKQTYRFITRITAARNEKQMDGIRSAFSNGATWQNFFSLITGAPGTGKTSVSVSIAAHCLERKWPLLIVCASNHGLNVITDRVTRYMQKNDIPMTGYYRLETDLAESCEMQVLEGVPMDMNDEENPNADCPQSPTFNHLYQDLRQRGVDEGLQKIMISSIQGMIDPGRRFSLGRHIKDALANIMTRSQDKQILGHRTWTAGESEESSLLWRFITFNELVRRQGDMFLQSIALVPTVTRAIPNPTSSRGNQSSDPSGIQASLLREQKEAWLRLQEFYLRNARVVLCTASTAGRRSLRNFKLAYLVVEEASQMAETHSLNPIMRNLNSLRKVILSGDTAQLPPTVISKGRNECFNTEIVSLFERMIKTGHPYTELNEQYRMAGDICKHVSKQFYGGRLRTHPSCNGRPHSIRFSEEMVKLFGCAPGTSFFVSVAKSSVWRRKQGTSLLNPEYVNFITTLVEELVAAGFAPRDILVLSFYDEERRALSSLLHGKMGLKDVEVKSVDAAQGSESPFVVLSTTRPRGSIGFVQNRPRQCVALSRAQYGLVVVGDEFMGKWSGEGYNSWDNLIQNHLAVGRLIRRDGHRDMMRLLGIPNQDWVEITRN